MKILLLFVSLSLLPLMACAQTAEKPQSGGPISLAAYPVVSDKVVKGEDQWKKELTAAQFDVLRVQGGQAFISRLSRIVFRRCRTTPLEIRGQKLNVQDAADILATSSMMARSRPVCGIA
jgi:hypothetical protein